MEVGVGPRSVPNEIPRISQSGIIKWNFVGEELRVLSLPNYENLLPCYGVLEMNVSGRKWSFD